MSSAATKVTRQMSLYRQPSEGTAASAGPSGRPSHVVAAALGSFMVLFDFYGIPIAVPRLAEAFAVSVSTAQLAGTLFIGGLTVTIPIAGALFDRAGVIRTVRPAMAIYVILSGVAGFVSSLPLLLGIRFAQGVCAGMITPASLTLVSTAVPSNRTGRAIGIWAGSALMAPVVAPPISGLVIDRFGASAFFIETTLVSSVALLWVVFAAKRAARPETPISRFDFAGYGILVGSLVLLTAASFPLMTRTLPAAALGLAVAGLGLIAVFVRHLRRKDNGLIAKELFRIATFRQGFAVAGLRSFLLASGTASIPLLLQTELRYSASMTGSVMLGPAALVALLSPWSSHLSDRKNPFALGAAGFFLTGISHVVLAALPHSASLVTLIAVLMVRAVGLSLITGPVLKGAIADVPYELNPRASAAINISQRTSGLFGVILLTAVLGLFDSRAWVVSPFLAFTMIPAAIAAYLSFKTRRRPGEASSA